MTRKGFGWLLLNNLISLSPNIPHYYVNIFHRVIEQFTVDFIVFEDPF